MAQGNSIDFVCLKPIRNIVRRTEIFIIDKMPFAQQSDHSKESQTTGYRVIMSIVKDPFLDNSLDYMNK
ncbi:hypothetical protein RO3G_06885 [Rhizopus delemar RA 99-880]|uniref:Uncharacterized protein n=1 Tax=Rhizopus delemar (strain RA 99-880 / ATCC MYA-4621 / FGSC 9543 / NRRL 43880) TaxID=246409 RepID=I1C150_RHIO9|nr:hypothetical protein RO3G_06885 [Rhizopus delemar RA 99-880]|eukprot:EIE82180.1 hypothetical protein RO3G_06885 [Rhizopus delemar RA 99-880]